MIDTILLLIAVACFAAATLNVKAPINLTALGLLFMALAFLLPLP